MKPEIREAWIKALKSGDYEQTSGALRRDNGFCCLGVLCNLHAIAHPELALKQVDVSWYLGEDAGLPKAVMQWAGIDSKYGEYTNGSLADDNDDGESFSTIARIINRNF